MGEPKLPGQWRRGGYRAISRSTLASFRNVARSPPFQALRVTFALPSVVFGPVDRSHGFQRRIN